MNRIAISLYDRFTSALRAADELIRSGIDPDAISLIAQESVVRHSPRLEQIEPQSLFGQPRPAYLSGIGPAVCSGRLGNRLGGASGSGYSLTNLLSSAGIPTDDSHFYAEAVRQGGVLLAVEMAGEHSDHVLDILNRYHPIVMDDQVRTWHQSGWNRFDEGAKPLAWEELNWPHNITARDDEDYFVSEEEELNWPATITDSSSDSDVIDKNTVNWPHNITSRERSTDPRDMDEHRDQDHMHDEAATNWPHNITARDDE